MKVDVLKIEYYMASKGYDKQKMAKLMGWSRGTLRNRFINPSDITLGEMDKMIEILEIARPGDVFYNL